MDTHKLSKDEFNTKLNLILAKQDLLDSLNNKGYLSDLTMTKEYNILIKEMQTIIKDYN